MLKPFSMIFFILVMVWMGGVFLTSNTSARIERACAPATVADKIVVAVTQLAYEPWALDAHEAMLHLEYGCRYTVWKTFYEDVLERSGTTTTNPSTKHSAGGAASGSVVSTQVGGAAEEAGTQKKASLPVTPAPAMGAEDSPQSSKSSAAAQPKPVQNYMDSQ